MARTNLTRIPKREREPKKTADALLQEQVDAQTAFQSSGLPPDWLTTGLAGAGAGWVFGPVGALVGAAVSGIVSKRRNDGILARATANAKDAQQLIEDGERSVAKLESEAKDDQDRYEAELIRNQFNQAVNLSRSGNPEASGLGLQTLMGMESLVQGEADEQEAALLARQEQEREQFSTEIARADGIRDDVQREGDTFATRQDAYERMLAVDDTAAGDQVLLVNSFKMVDPDSAVLPGEAATAANAAGVPDWMLTLYNRGVRDGERLEPDQRADLIRQAGLQYGVARADQIDRNTSAIERARAQGIRDELLPAIGMPVKDSDELPFAKPPRGPDEAVEEGLRGPVEAVLPDPVAKIFGTERRQLTDPGPPVEITSDGMVLDRERGIERFIPDVLQMGPRGQDARKKMRGDEEREPGLFQEGGFFNRETN